MMEIGILKEIRAEEYRVPLAPQAVRRLVEGGHGVWVQKEAGLGSGFSDEDYEAEGAQVLERPRDLCALAQLVLKVKDPLPEEFSHFREGQILCAYLVPGRRPDLVEMLLSKRITAFAMEEIRLSDGSKPLLSPMSVIAGQQAVLQGMQFLWNHKGGAGKSLAAYPGLEPARVVVLGAGRAGIHAAATAAALGAEVCVFETDTRRIAELSSGLREGIRLFHVDSVPLAPYVCGADMVINTATVPGGSPRHLIDRHMVSRMIRGSVIVDVTAHLKGAIETIDRHTTHADPVWEVDGVIHYCVPNIPGTVAATASRALSMALVPYVLEIAERGVSDAFRANEALRHGLVTMDGSRVWGKDGDTKR